MPPGQIKLSADPADDVILIRHSRLKDHPVLPIRQINVIDMPTKLKLPPKRNAKLNGSRPTMRELVEVAEQLPERQFQTLRKKLDNIHLARWYREREEVAQRIAAKGITEQSIDDYIARRRREGRR